MIVDIHTHKKYGTNSVFSHSIRQLRNEMIEDEHVLFSAGFHPMDVTMAQDSDWDLLNIASNMKNCVMIGECGLDKLVNLSLEEQQTAFRKHIFLSEALKKPLLIHCVGYFNELIQLKKELHPEQSWIIHGFRGKPQLATQLLKAGFALSYGSLFNYESIKITPLECLYIETDESAESIESIYEKIASLKAVETSALLAGETLIKRYLSSSTSDLCE